jgi:hypothetical protein
MARINIDDDFWEESADVVAAVGDKFRAYGMVLAFFKASQSKFKQAKAMSDKEFAERGFHESLIGPFAERTEIGIMARGSKKHFGWLAKRQAAGKKGGIAKASKPKQVKATSGKSKQPEASYSYSYSYSPSKNNIPASPDGFAEFYLSYPRKVGKTAAMKAWRRAASKPDFSLADLLVAREKYRAYFESSGVEAKFVKHPATFLGEWRDWLDPITGTSDLKTEQERRHAEIARRWSQEEAGA